MKAVILAGGLGTRLREETEFRPKPMVEIGGQPILWHLMKLFARHAITDFVVPIGYRGEVIRDYFLNYEGRTNDFTIRLGPEHATSIEYHTTHLEAGWQVTVVDTGAETPTGGRVRRIHPYVEGERFMVTYGDGLADVDLGKLLAFHESHGKMATMTTVRPMSRFGIVEFEPDGAVRSFREKPLADDYVNAGFFVFEPEVFTYLEDDVALEEEPLEALAADGQLSAYTHDGFFQPMDTYREFTLLNGLWNAGRAPWKVWDE
jgi:glucose-1-phosphate cytidylyltransferase